MAMTTIPSANPERHVEDPHEALTRQGGEPRETEFRGWVRREFVGEVAEGDLDEHEDEEEEAVP